MLVKLTTTFEFDIDDLVRTKLGDKGIVCMAALDDSRKTLYCVKLLGGVSNWFKEEELSIWEEG
jgi:hypothetical protein